MNIIVYVLTTEYNLYDQQGEYFVAVFANIPTKKQLLALGVPKVDIEHVQAGGGRKLPYKEDDMWFNLHEHKLKDVRITTGT